MKRRILAALIVLALAAGTTGCATVQKKFTRKKKTPERNRSVIYLDEGAHQKKYSNAYYYKTHFTFWRTWHDELIDNLRNGNNKRLRRSLQEVVSHLTEMSGSLEPEAKSGLDEQIGRLELIRGRIESGYYNAGFENLRPEIEQIGRVLNSNYSYGKVQDKLRPDQVDLGAGSPAPV